MLSQLLIVCFKFSQKLSIHKFGTAGIRKKVGLGPNRLNDVTVTQITNGLLKCAESTFGLDRLRKQGVVIERLTGF